jgi:hypothetical protein
VVVAAESEERWALPERPLSLAAQPGRPGHVLATLEIMPGHGARRRVNDAARRLSLPAELVAAVALEATRSLESTARIVGWAPDELAEELRIRAAGESIVPLISAKARRLTAYAEALASAPGSRPLAPSVARVTATAPMLAAWAHSAAAESMDVSVWACALLERCRPKQAVAWERAAAGRGATLCEWVQAAALRAVRAAVPQPRM